MRGPWFHEFLTCVDRGQHLVPESLRSTCEFGATDGAPPDPCPQRTSDRALAWPGCSSAPEGLDSVLGEHPPRLHTRPAAQRWSSDLFAAAAVIAFLAEKIAT